MVSFIFGRGEGLCVQAEEQHIKLMGSIQNLLNKGPAFDLKTTRSPHWL
jgi:hypothetical protein